MKESMDNKIKSAVSKRLREQQEEKEFIFEGIEFYESKTLGEFFEENDREDYIWEESLAESLEEESDEIVGNRAVQYKVGDIIMTNRYKSHGSYVEDSQHKILVVTSRVESDGIINYEGFLLSSKAKEKSNKYNERYPHNIYINPYNSILYKGAPSNKQEVFIRVDDLVKFTNMDLSISGSWKGKASWEFLNFVQRCANNYRAGKDNSKIFWER